MQSRDEVRKELGRDEASTERRRVPENPGRLQSSAERRRETRRHR